MVKPIQGSCDQFYQESCEYSGTMTKIEPQECRLTLQFQKFFTPLIPEIQPKLPQ